MKKAVVVILAFVGCLSLLAFVGLFLLTALLATGRSVEGVPRSVILEADFEKGVVESIPDDPLAQVMTGDVMPLQDVVEALDRGAKDRRVKAFVARIGGGGIGLAHLQEIRDAVARFRAAGKPTFAWAETFGEFGPGTGGYYLATAFDEIDLQPSGDVGLTGLMYESPFIRGLFDKLGVEPQMDHRKEFKNAMNFYTERTYTEPHRRAMQELMDSQFAQMVRGIAASRHLEPAQVTRLVDEGPYLGAEALTAKLVDRLAYRDEVYERVREQAGAKAETLELTEYLRRAGSSYRSGPTIALIHGYGAVVRGRSSYSPLDGSATMGADTVAAAFRAAAEDKRVKAIVFRVDSPGGSYVASDTIRRETERARKAGKPLIVSMGNLAGSGGYFVALDADKVVAQPGTITASIGVLGGKLLTRKAWDKIGVTWDDVATSRHARMWSSSYEYGDSWSRFQASLDRVYDDFTQKVAEGRKLPIDQVLDVAKGRIWTGEKAKELGLVDELGGLDVALDLAREAAGLDRGAPIRIKPFPPKRSPLEMLLARAGGESAEGVVVARLLRSAQPALHLLARLGLVGEPGVLSLPDPGPQP
jgi:protease IV